MPKEAGEPMRPAPTLLVIVLGAAAGCRSLAITPDALRAPVAPGEAAGRPDDRLKALDRWQAAIGLINEFLASPWRATLPAGRFELTDGGMTYTTTDGRELPVAVASTWWGDLVVASGFRAQEGEDGFCVGEIDRPEGETGDPLIDHTFFRFSDGGWHDIESLAEVTLHETTHDFYRVGTVGPWNTFGYYAVAVFTLSASTHPAEDRPRATSEEFRWFCQARRTAPGFLDVLERARDQHLASEDRSCEHGPFE
jgi:hypothetical protein